MGRKRKTIRGDKRGAEHGNTLFYGAFDSPVGTVYVALDGKKVIALSFTSNSEDDFCAELLSRTSRAPRRSDASVRAVVSELREYFAGERTKFGFSPDLSGYTAFQKGVLKAAASIPYGQTRTYGWLADRVNRPRAARAVGQVMAHNPVPIMIPCHRVIGSTGGLCGFAGGLRALDLKRKLLAIEGTKV